MEITVTDLLRDITMKKQQLSVKRQIQAAENEKELESLMSFESLLEKLKTQETTKL